MDTLFETHTKNDDEPNTLTMWDMRGGFFVLVTGHSIAIVSYLFELSYLEFNKLFL